jgi:hypothetical protein
MGRPKYAIDAAGKYPSPVTVFNREFQNSVSAILFSEAGNGQIRRLSLPSEPATVKEIDFAANLFLELIDSDSVSPAFAVLYASLILSYDLTNVSDSMLRVLIRFSQKKAYDAELLNVVIPLVHSRKNSLRRVVEQLATVIIERYSISEFLQIYCECLKVWAVTVTQLRFLRTIMEKHSPGPQDLALIRRALAGIAVTAGIQAEISALQEKLTGVSDPDPSEVSKFTISSPSRVKPERTEMLSLLDQIDRKIQYSGTVTINEAAQLDDPLQIIARLAAHLRAFGFPKDRAFQPLFVFTFQTWSSRLDLKTFGRWADDVLKAIYALPGKADQILSFYREVARDTTLRIDADTLQSSYLTFKRVAKELHGFDCPVVLVGHDTGDLSGDIEKAFEWIAKWETSFDGLNLLWSLVVANPACSLTAQFDKLLFSRKQFIIQGCKLRYNDLASQNNEILELIDFLERRALKPRVNVDAAMDSLSAKAKNMALYSSLSRTPRSRDSRVSGRP